MTFNELLDKLASFDTKRKFVALMTVMGRIIKRGDEIFVKPMVLSSFHETGGNDDDDDNYSTHQIQLSADR
jgi:hypothetical protein